MPFARISVGPHRSAADVNAISEGVYESLIEAVHAPRGDKFQAITTHSAEELVYSKDYVGIQRSEQFTFIQLFFYPGRTVAQKKLLYKTIADKLAVNPGMRKEDIFINLIDVPKENWSYGNGEAQFAAPDEPSGTLNSLAAHHPAARSPAWLPAAALGLSLLSLTLTAVLLTRKR